MLLMFVLWIAVFVGIARNWRWTPGLSLVTMVVTVVLLRVHMTSPIPLNF
jgi:hypothetical protein